MCACGGGGLRSSMVEMKGCTSHKDQQVQHGTTNIRCHLDTSQ